MDVNLLATMFSDPEKSAVVGKWGAAVMPAAPDGHIQAASGTAWMLSIPNASKKKELAWSLIKWISSKEMALRLAVEAGQVARSSVWSSPDFLKAMPFPDWVEASELTINKYSKEYRLPQIVRLPQAAEIIDIALQEIYLGKTAKDALAQAQKETEEILAK